MDAPNQKFTMNLPLDPMEVASLKRDKPSELISSGEAERSITRALQFTQDVLLREKRKGSILPEIVRQSPVMQRYDPPGAKQETMLHWKTKEEEEWFGVIQHYLRWMGNLDEFGSLHGKVLDIEGKHRENAIYGLLRLLAEHAEQVLLSNRTQSKKQLDARSKRFVASIIAPPRRGQIRLQIASIYPPESPMCWHLGQCHIELRRITQADLDGDTVFRGLNPGMVMPDALCFVEGEGDDSSLRDIGDVIVTAARLFANADPDVLRDEYLTDDLCNLLRGSVRWHERRPWRYHPFIFDASTARVFVAFTKALYATVGTNILFKQSWGCKDGKSQRSDPSHWLQIAADRYNDALRASDLLERKVASSVMSIESLILKPGEKSELLYRVSMRCAVIGDLLGLDSREIRRTAGRAYDIRSKFVHGGLVSSKEIQKLNREFEDYHAFEDRVVTLNRLLLLVATFSKLDKEELVNGIDDAMILPSTRKLLASKIRQVLPFLNDIDVLRPKVVGGPDSEAQVQPEGNF